ncbi:MAG: hypothetical protein GXY44_10905 [Phycisphaerales bacterium]|nr:hypothetical protein [Phycisphaerales bacterium]
MHRIMDDQCKVMDWTTIGRRVRQSAELAARLHELHDGLGLTGHRSMETDLDQHPVGLKTSGSEDLESSDGKCAGVVRGVRSEN